jgi:hypothetical protein
LLKGIKVLLLYIMILQETNVVKCTILLMIHDLCGRKSK